MSSITITVPMDYFALTRASDMLHGMALDLENEGKRKGRRTDDKAVAVEAPSRTDAEAAFRHAEAASGSVEEFKERAAGIAEEKDAASVFGGTPGKPTAPAASEPEPRTESTTPTAAPAETEAPGKPTAPTASETAPVPPAATTGAAAATTAETPDTVPSATEQEPPKVDVDSDGLPWDSRIHAGSKGKLAKTKQWKKKRGVDPELVEKVEAELRATMSASPANPVEPSAESQAHALQAAEGYTSAPAAPPASPAPAPVPATSTGAITSFPALMTRITAEGVAQADVTAAVNKQGLQALPLLAARPDLIPAVAAELFPGG